MGRSRRPRSCRKSPLAAIMFHKPPPLPSTSTARDSSSPEPPPPGTEELSRIRIPDDPVDPNLAHEPVLSMNDMLSNMIAFATTHSPRGVVDDSGAETEAGEEPEEEIRATTSPSTSTSHPRSRPTSSYDIPGRLLIRGSNARPPITRMVELSLPKPITDALNRSGVASLNFFQKAVAPNLLRGSDLIIVAPDSGKQVEKTARLISYNLPILKLVDSKYGQMPTFQADQCFPDALIVVSSFNTGVAFEVVVKNFLSFCPDLQRRVKFVTREIPGVTPRRQVLDRMLPTGVSILITTIDYLDALLQTKHGAFLCNHLTFIVFEELEQYVKQKPLLDQIRLFVSTLRQNLHCTGRSPFQLCFSASRWLPELEEVYALISQERSPSIIISNMIQAMRFAGVKWELHHILPGWADDGETDDALINEAKMKSLLGILKTASHHSTVIACSTSIVADTIHKWLCERSRIYSLPITAKSKPDYLEGARRAWNTLRLTVLIIPDEMLPHVTFITDATRLIVYDSPVHKLLRNGCPRPLAAERFAYMWSSFRKLELERKEGDKDYRKGKQSSEPVYFIPKPSGKPLIAHFLLTGEEPNFVLMYNFAKRLGKDATIPSRLAGMAKMQEDYSTSTPLCEGFKLFGFCNLRDPSSCLNRHFFNSLELTNPTTVPLSGELELRIMRVLNPSHYRARLLSHYDYDAKGNRRFARSFRQELNIRHSNLSHFMTEGKGINRRRPESWDVGQLVCVFHPQMDAWTRASIISAPRRTPTESFAQVRVDCIDVGDTLNPRGAEVFSLPPLFAECPVLTCNVVLSNLKPPQEELEYRVGSERKVSEWLLGKELLAKVWLTVGHLVWVNPLVEMENKMRRRTLSVRMELIAQGLAENNKGHLKFLMEQVREHGNTYKGLNPKVKVEEEGDELEQEPVREQVRVQLRKEEEEDEPLPVQLLEELEQMEVDEEEEEEVDLVKILGEEDGDEEAEEPLQVELQFSFGGVVRTAEVNMDMASVTAMMNQIKLQKDPVEIEGEVNVKSEPEEEEVAAIAAPEQKRKVKKAKRGNKVKLSSSVDDVIQPEPQPEVKVEEKVVVPAPNQKIQVKKRPRAPPPPPPKPKLEALVEEVEEEEKEGIKDVKGETPPPPEPEPEPQPKVEEKEAALSKSAEDVKVEVKAASSLNPRSLLKPNLVDGDALPHPDLVWRQTDTHFFLRVDLPDITFFSVKVGMDFRLLNFRTIGRSRNYGFTLHLYGKVYREYQTQKTGRHLLITFTKRMSGVEWPRALFDKRDKNRFLKEDLTQANSSEDEEEQKQKESEKIIQLCKSSTEKEKQKKKDKEKQGKANVKVHGQGSEEEDDSDLENFIDSVNERAEKEKDDDDDDDDVEEEVF